MFLHCERSVVGPTGCQKITTMVLCGVPCSDYNHISLTVKQFLLTFETQSQPFAFSARSLGHLMVWLTEIAKETEAGGTWEGHFVSLLAIHRWGVFLHFSLNCPMWLSG